MADLDLGDERRENSGRVEAMPSPMSTWTRAAATVFVIVCVAFWIFAFSPWARDMFVAPDGLDDDVFAERIERRCATARSALEELPSIRSAESPEQRAVTLIQANEVLETMVAEIAAFDSTVLSDQEVVARWLDDWQIYLDDRAVHVDRLAAGEDDRFLNSEADGIFIAERMNGFARRNDLDSCETPGDL